MTLIVSDHQQRTNIYQTNNSMQVKAFKDAGRGRRKAESSGGNASALLRMSPRRDAVYMVRPGGSAQCRIVEHIWLWLFFSAKEPGMPGYVAEYAIDGFGASSV